MSDSLTEKIDQICYRNAERRYETMLNDLKVIIRKNIDYSGECGESRGVKDKLLEVCESSHEFLVNKMYEQELSNFQNKFDALFNYVTAASKED